MASVEMQEGCSVFLIEESCDEMNFASTPFQAADLSNLIMPQCDRHAMNKNEVENE